MAVPLAFGALFAIGPLGWKSTGRSLSVDVPWPDDLEPAGDFQITNMAEFHEAREQYRRDHRTDRIDQIFAALRRR